MQQPISNLPQKTPSALNIVYVREIAKKLFDSSAYGAINSWKWAESHTDLSKRKTSIYRAIYTVPILMLVVIYCIIIFITYTIKESFANIPLIATVAALGLIAVLFLIIGYSYRLMLMYYLLKTNRVNIL